MNETTLVLEAHQDDAVLFSSFNAIRHDARVLTVLGDARLQPGVDMARRDRENALALQKLGLRSPVSWRYRDDDPDWPAVEGQLTYEWKQRPGGVDRVFAPWPEPSGGNASHDRLAEIAVRVFGDRVRFYTTYRVGGPRTEGVPVPYEPDWLLRKHAALAEFVSQVTHGPHRFWLDGLEEWTR